VRPAAVHPEGPRPFRLPDKGLSGPRKRWKKLCRQ